MKEYLTVLWVWQRRGSVGRDTRLVIERLRILGSTFDAVARSVVLGKDTYAVSHFGAKQSTRCGGPA